MGDNIVTGRDERGLYVNYDALRITLGSPSKLEFCFQGQCVGSLHTGLQEGDRLEIRDVEGRFRIDPKA